MEHSEVLIGSEISDSNADDLQVGIDNLQIFNSFAVFCKVELFDLCEGMFT